MSASTNNRKRLAVRLGRVLLIGLVACLVAHSEGVAARRRPGHGANQAREAPEIDERTAQRLNRALEHLRADQFAEARAALAKIKLHRLSPFERARVENVFAAIAQSEGSYAEAAKHITLAMESGGLNDQEMQAAQFQVAQLLVAQQQWKEGIAAWNKWFASGAAPNSAAYFLLAMCHYQLQQYDAAVGPAQKAVDIAEKPQESWLSLLVALRVQREEYALALPICKRLVQDAPDKKNHWLQLSSVYGMQEQTAEALATVQLAYYGGLLTEPSEYRRLVELLAYERIPHRAAEILALAIRDQRVSGGVRDWEALASLWYEAREFERAVEPMDRAASLAKTGDSYYRLAEVHARRERWHDAVEALNRAFVKGELKNEESAWLLMGIALHGEKRLQEARKWFQKATQSPKTKSAAEGWVKYIDGLLRG